MFSRVGNDLYLSKGDTGKLNINIDSAYLMTSDDVVLFTVKDGDTPIITEIATATANVATIQFTNAMTKNLQEKDYRYDIRIILDATISQGAVTGGEEVKTPFKPAKFCILETVGDV